MEQQLGRIQWFKDRYPKTITGGVIIGEVTAWVQEAAEL